MGFLWRHLSQPRAVYLFAICCSLLLSSWLAYKQILINPDAICYLQSAKIIGAGGLRKAMNLCPQAQWPFYSVLIYSLATIFHLSVEIAAYAVDAFFSTLTVVTFIAVVRQLGGTGRVLWLAAAVILLAHEFNAVRHYIVRDHGYWAFYLCSLFLLLRYLSLLRWTYALGWSVSLLSATLFRLEGIVFLVLIPWGLWFLSSLSGWQRCKSFFQLNLIPLVTGTAVLGWLIFHPEISLASLGRLQDVVFQIFHAGGFAWQRFQESAQAFGHSALTIDSFGEAKLVFFLAILMWYLVKLVANLSFVYSALLVYALWRKLFAFSQNARFVIISYLVVNLIITSLFLAEHFFLSKRYLIALALILMLMVPFAFEKLLAERQQLRRWVIPLIVLLWLISAVGGIVDFGHSKTYIRQAGDWLAKNIPSTALLYSNDYQVMYYSQHFGDELFEKFKEYSDPELLSHDHWKDYDYLALRISKKDLLAGKGIYQEVSGKLMQVFANSHDDEVRIYKIEAAE